MEILIGIGIFCLVSGIGALGWAVWRLRWQLRAQEKRIADLTRRVYALEPLTERTQPPAEPATSPEAAVPPPLPAAQPTGQDWEAVVGANWLNRAGALVLVIGIALLLGFSLTQLGPGGKVAIGFLSGASMLLLGIVLRSSERYETFSVSFIGAGWAAIYFTAYASYALEPARVVHSQAVAAILLLAVSTCMIVHALWYESEHGAALAFVFGFITLNVTPLTGLNVVAAMVLASATLIVALLRRWFRLAVAGVVLSYATFLLRHEATQPLAQLALWAQWIAFESFDLLDVWRRGLKRGLGATIFPLNACGFIGVSLLYRSGDLGWFLFASAFAYLLSSMLRARLAPRSEGAPLIASTGGYEGALAASAVLMAAALIERFSGTTMTLALLIEGEMIVLAGDALANRFIRRLGGVVLSACAFRLLFVDALEAKNARVWTPLGGLVSATLLFNRLRGGWGYAAGGGLILGAIIAAETSRAWTPAWWGLLGVGALVLANRLNLKDVRYLHLALAVATWIAGIVATDEPKATLAIAITVGCFYAWEFLVRGGVRYAAVGYSILGTLLLTVLLFQKVHGGLLTVALAFQGVGLLIVGFITSERVLRLSGLAVFLLCLGKAFLYDLRELDTFSRILSFIALGLLLLGASWVYTKFRDKIQRLL